MERIERLRSRLLHGTAGLLSVLVVLVLSADLSLAFAQNARAGEPDTIEGVVTSAVSKAPVAGVEVCTGRYVGQQNCVSTKADGTYDVPAPAVSLPVEFKAPPGSGLVSHTYYKGVYLLSEATELVVPVGETLSGIDAELQPEGRIEGVVTNAATKAPIEGAEVCASPLGAWPEEPVCVRTGADGVYEIVGLAPVQYKVSFDPAGLNYLPETPQREYKQYPTVTVGKTTANVDVALPEGGQIEGHVKSAASGLALSGVQVCASGFGPSLATTCANTDSGGHYVINGLETSSYHVFFSNRRPYVGQSYDGGTALRVNQGEVLTDVDASLLTGTTISGVVTSAGTGKPMKGVEVCVDERVGEEVSAFCSEPNEAGEYELTGIPTSTDTVEFRPKSNIYEYETQYWNHVGVSTEATELHTTAGEVITGIDAALKARYGAISGHVLAASDKEGISLAEVCATNLSNGRTRCAGTSGSGEYQIAFLPGGSYIVEFSTPHQRPGYTTQYYDDRASEAEAVPVTVSPGATTQSIDAELAPEPVAEEHEGTTGSRIAGVVSSSSTLQPIAGMEVCIYDLAEEETEEGPFGQCTLTGTNGEYALAGLSDGEYLVEFYSPPASGLDYVTQYYDGVESFEQATPVRVGPQTDDVGIDAQMREGGRIAGRVTDASTKAPLTEVLVCALTTGKVIVDCAITGESGEYAIAGVPAGSYAVGFAAAEGYEVQYYDNETTFAAADQVTATAGSTTSRVDAAMHAIRRSVPPPVDPPAPPPGGSPPSGSAVVAPKSGVAASTTTVLPAVAAEASKVLVSGRRAFVRLSCSMASCSGTVELTTQVSVSDRGRSKSSRHRQTIVLAKGAFHLAKGQSARIVLRLTAAGRRRLAGSTHRRLSAKLILSVEGGRTVVSSVTVGRRTGSLALLGPHSALPPGWTRASRR